MYRTGVQRDRHSGVCVKGYDRPGSGAKRRVRDQKSELSISGGDQLEATEDFRRHSFGGTEFSAAADGQRGRKLHMKRLGQVRLLGCSLLLIVHGHHLTHAAGQVVEQP